MPFDRKWVDHIFQKQLYEYCVINPLINPLMIGANKKSYMLQQNTHLKAAGLFKYVWNYVTNRH